jgi:hypothetical protein
LIGGSDYTSEGSATFSVPFVNACGETTVSLNISGGSYCGEITWDLSDGSSGAGCGDWELCLADGDYTFNAHDSYGDGWNGNVASFSDADGAIASFTLDGVSDDGSDAAFTLTIGGAPPVAGCMDACATNYNADAAVEDGSCTFDNTGLCYDNACYNYDIDGDGYVDTD